MSNIGDAATLFLGLSQQHGVGFKTLREFGGVHQTARKLLNGELDEFLSSIFPSKSVDSIESTLWASGMKALEDLERAEVDLISIGDEKYPSHFMDLPPEDRPLWIFCRGNKALLDTNAVAVVGTRSPTLVGEFLTKCAVSVLAEEFIPVVSGLARGIDSVAHEWALVCNVPTISVLGTGILRPYPAKNIDLAQRITDQGGLLISEYLPWAEPSGDNFVWRNRLQAALSACIIAPEWKRSSGTAHTIRFANALKRPTINVWLETVAPASSHGDADMAFYFPRDLNLFRSAVLRAMDELKSARQALDLFGTARA